MRDVLRFMLGISIVLGGYILFFINPIAGVAGMVLLLVNWKIFMKLRNYRRNQLCAGCADLKSNTVCPGYEIHAELIRRYEKKALKYLTTRINIPNLIR
jgi:hypothetical protein